MVRLPKCIDVGAKTLTPKRIEYKMKSKTKTKKKKNRDDDEDDPAVVLQSFDRFSEILFS